jgi:GntR family transcriptional repressor for pyruvate dehydrogenase complex
MFSGTLKLGERLPTEREMAKQFGLSRVVVREAIRTLELSGLVLLSGMVETPRFSRPDPERGGAGEA